MSRVCDILIGMTLAECIADMGLTIAEFADLAGIHPATIYRLNNGEPANGGTISKIVVASAGRLTPNDLVAVPAPHAAKAATKKSRRRAA